MNITNTVLQIRERDNDMNKKWLAFIISFLLVAAIIGAGGKMYMDQRAEQKEAEKIKEERMSVEALKNTFEVLKSLEFEKSGYEPMTGDYNMIVIIINVDGEYVKFDYFFTPNQPEEIAAWGVVDEEKVLK